MWMGLKSTTRKLLQAYMDSNLMRLFRALITGGEVTDFEKALGEGLRVLRRHALADVTIARNRSIFVSLVLNEHPLNRIQVNCGHSCIQARYDTEWWSNSLSTSAIISNQKPDDSVRIFDGNNVDGNMVNTCPKWKSHWLLFFGVRKTARFPLPLYVPIDLKQFFPFLIFK